MQQAYGGGPQTPEGQTETAILQFLALFFLVIMVEGIFIAASVRSHMLCASCNMAVPRR